MLPRLLILFYAAFPAGALAQSVVLSIGSGSAAAGSSVAVAINIASTTGVASVEWSFGYPAGMLGLAVAAGGAATGAQKSVVCAGNTCLAYGLNQKAIANGTVAVATFRLASNVSVPAIPIKVLAVSAASPAGAPVTAGGGSGLITLLPRRSEAPSRRCCRTKSTTRALETGPDQQVTLTIGPDSGPIPPIPIIADHGILNAASLSSEMRNDGLARVAAGSLVSIFGANLGTTAASVTVTFNGAGAPLAFVSDTQINAQVPAKLLRREVESAIASVVVTVEGVPSTPQLVRMVRTSPGVFSIPAGGNALLHSVADGTLAAPPSLRPICGCSTRPTQPGENAVFYATGLGDSELVSPVILVGGIRAVVTFVGPMPQYPGVDQISIIIPPNAPIGGRIPLQVQAGDATSTDKVTIAIGPGS